jgi:hypothetical protein
MKKIYEFMSFISLLNFLKHQILRIDQNFILEFLAKTLFWKK